MTKRLTEAVCFTPQTAETITSEKLALRNLTVSQWPDNPLAGLELGKAYKEQVYGVIKEWFTANTLPEERKNFTVAAFGSTARGELSFFSDIDLAIVSRRSMPKRKVTELKQALSQHLNDLGYFPEIKTWSLTPKDQEAFANDLVLLETIMLSEPVTGNEKLLGCLKNTTSAYNPQRKAIYQCFEMLKPRLIKREPGVFNLKWEHQGGLIDFLVLRSIALATGSQGSTTPEFLQGLQESSMLAPEEYQTLCMALSEFMIYRNEMHIFAQGNAERLGPRTRYYINQHLPQVGTPKELENRIELVRNQVHKISQKVIHQYLAGFGVDPKIYDTFPGLPTEKQLELVRSEKLLYSELAAWTSESTEVLQACMDQNPNWSVLNGIARSQSVTQEILQQIEAVTRKRSDFNFTRLQIAVNPETTPEILIDLYRHTYDDRIRSTIRKRLAHLLYDQREDIDSKLRPLVDAMIFYPPQLIPKVKFINGREWLRPTEGKVYLNFAGRLARGKNFIEFLKALDALNRSGVDFEAHVYGTVEPFIGNQMHDLWEKIATPDLIAKIKYHGQYTPKQLTGEIGQMSQLGFPVFLFSKGLVTKELLMSEAAVMTTTQGNIDVLETGIGCFDENSLESEITSRQIVGTIGQAVSRRPLMQVQAQTAKKFVEEHYSFDQWGEKISAAVDSVQPQSRSLLLLGTTHLIDPHGPVVWSRNLITYFQSRQRQADYYYPEEVMIKVSPNPLSADSVTLAPLEQFTRLAIKASHIGWNPSSVEAATRALIDFGSHPQASAFLASEEAKAMFYRKASDNDFDPLTLSYETLIFDEVDIYGILLKPHLKLARWLKLMQVPLPENQVIMSNGGIFPLLAIREKIRRGTPFIHVDHVLASDEPLLRGINDSDFYTPAEKQWLLSLNSLVKKATYLFLDRYLALWPVNARIAAELGVASEKICYIPNAVSIC